MFGVAYVCARDRFSRKIDEQATMGRKNNLLRYEEVFRLMVTRIMYFGFLKYFEVSHSLRNSLRCNIKASQLVFYNGKSFY